jgi:phosphatidate cytidylyltransferase
MLKQRLLTAFIGVPLLLWLFIQGPALFQALLVGVVGTFCFYELSSFLAKRLETDLHLSAQGIATIQRYRWTLQALVSLLLIFSALAWRGEASAILSWVVVLLMIVVVAVLFIDTEVQSRMQIAAMFSFAVSYAVLPWLAVIYLIRQPYGGHWVLLLLSLVWMSDTGGYFGGRFFGKTPLAPSISPKKTREGALAGVACSMLVVGILHFVIPGYFGNPIVLVVLAALVAIVGQLGDLVESMAKRYAMVKDSGTIIPGHGGLLDRVDAVLAAAPVMWVFHYHFA